MNEPILIRAVKRLISLIALIFNRSLIAVLMQILFVCVEFAGRRRRPIAVER